jgi:NAD(P)-dependent dehydrogenase (short-subunit alcohol dehydrogenase family)
VASGDVALAGKVALVTGGSHGIGEAICLALADAGADVVLTYHSDRLAADEVARRSQQRGVQAVVVQADLDTVAGAGDLVVRARNQLHRPDIVVSNATSSIAPGRLADLDADALGRKAGTDLGVLHTLATAFAPAMHERGFGRLLVISSVHALGPGSPGMCAHGATKAALEAYVRYAADELGGDGVTVNALRLGFVATRSTAAVPPPARDLLTAATPAGRLAGPGDIAAVASLLAQPAAGWINGAIIPVAGGLNQPLNLARLLAQARPFTR